MSQEKSQAADPRFALAGSGGRAFAAKFGISYYSLEGNYNPVSGMIFSSADPVNDPPPGLHVVRKVAKLNVRLDSLGESNAQFQTKLFKYAQDLAAWYPIKWGKKPQFKWFSPNADSLIASESRQIIETIRREKKRNPPVTGTVWEIGNEPNLFPAITPAEYAAIFDRYFRVIKSEDPSAKVALGPFFMPETAEDLKAKLREQSEKIGNDLELKLTDKVKALGLSGVVNPKGFIPFIINDIKAVLMSRMLAETTPEYVGHVMELLAVRPDIVTLHIYPYDDRPPFLNAAELGNLVNDALDKLSVVLEKENTQPEYWITEFGNVNPGYSPERVASQTLDLLGLFKANPKIARWFYYKSVGSDEQLALITSGKPPLTRLATDSTFIPADGHFPCSRLNAIGRAYYREARGEDCLEHVGFAAKASARTAAGAGLPIRVRLDAPSDREVSVRYELSNLAEEDDYSRASGNLVFAPGETEKLLPPEAGRFPSGENSAGKRSAATPGDTLRWVLRDADGAGISDDSLHAVAILPGEDAPPVIDSLLADKSVIEEGDSLSARAYAEDPESDSLAYAWTNRNGRIIGHGAAVVYHAEKGGRGPDTLSVRVSDGRGGTVLQSFAFVIIPPYAEQAQGSAKKFLLDTTLAISAVPMAAHQIMFKYAIPARGKVRLHILDSHGRIKAVLVDGTQGPGTHSLLYDTRDGSRGILYGCLRANGSARTTPLVLLH